MNFKYIINLMESYKQLTGSDKISYRLLFETTQEFDSVKNSNPELLLKVENGEITINDYINSFNL